MKQKSKWMVVINCFGIYGPMKIEKKRCGEWVDKTGDWCFISGQDVAFNSLREAQIYKRGAMAVAKNLVETWKK